MNVSGMINKNLVSMDESSSVRAVAQRMLDEKVSSILVTRGSAIVGLVTAHDLLGYLVKNLGDEKNQDRGGALEGFPYSPLFTEAMRELNAAGI